MSTAIQIRTLLLARKMTIKDLAERLGTNGNNLSNKLARDNFYERDLYEIAEALGCDCNISFTMRDTGKTI